MSSQIALLDVFVSAPRDVETQRRLVQKVVHELAEELQQERSVRLQPFFWEEDAIPGISSSGQDVISRQITDKCDIYIGVLGQRFGQPTAKAGSGTEEEFNDAYDRYTKDTASVRVLFYFKKTVDDIYKLDIDEVKKLETFRSKLRNAGVLYKDFSSDDELRDSLSKNIKGLIRSEWQGSHWQTQEKPGVITIISPSGKEEEELLENQDDEDGGFLDVLASGEEAIAAFITTLAEIARHAEVLGEQIVLDTEQAVKANQTGSAQLSKAAVNGAADTLISYAKGLSRELPSYSSNGTQTILAIGRIATFHFTEGLGTKEQVISMSSGLSDLLNAMRSARSSMRNLRDQIQSTPSLTVKFKKARNTATELLAEFLSQTTMIIGQAEAVRADVEQNLSDA